MENQLFQFTCLPNELSSAPRIFTKLMKPVYSVLRSQGFENVGYIDDTYLKGSTFQNCETKVSDTVKLLCSLGFTLNLEKSVLIPSKFITFGVVCIELCSDDSFSHSNESYEVKVESDRAAP